MGAWIARLFSTRVRQLVNCWVSMFVGYGCPCMGK